MALLTALFMGSVRRFTEHADELQAHGQDVSGARNSALSQAYHPGVAEDRRPFVSGA